MPESPGPERTRQQAAREAKAARKASSGEIAVELMKRWNHDEHDPSKMAVNGHETSFCYEFFIQKNGAVYVISARRDLVEE